MNDFQEEVLGKVYFVEIFDEEEGAATREFRLPQGARDIRGMLRGTTRAPDPDALRKLREVALGLEQYRALALQAVRQTIQDPLYDPYGLTPEQREGWLALDEAGFAEQFQLRCLLTDWEDRVILGFESDLEGEHDVAVAFVDGGVNEVGTLAHFA